jgi:hypothetical protein
MPEPSGSAFSLHDKNGRLSEKINLHLNHEEQKIGLLVFKNQTIGELAYREFK